ncbi:MAG TPA: HD domain-containing phosphohydrolase [Burkholderiales bacterium]|jgi:HD-GYP domain-containing protein (c-di-GMP phosphodiesterase class II)|nr:HD domain-containing phosphohydrolase [Burkholderiales bacterium]
MLDTRQLRGSIEALTIALDVRDAYTRSHCDRVVRLAAELGVACNLTEAELDCLRVAARFHDIGKVGIPDAVLRKPGPLTADEWALMRNHPEYGERILSATAIPELAPITKVIRHHHEAYDGTGYPDRLKGEGIPLASRIMLVVDAYDAMSSTRPNSRSRTHAEIMQALASEAGSRLDPEVFREFSARIEASPSRAQ